METARETLAAARIITPWWQRLALRPLRHPRLLRFGSSLLAVAQRMRLVPDRLALPDRLPLRRRRHRISGSDVYLFTGCVMDAWQRNTHFAAQRVIEAAGFGVTPTADLVPCCGALHAHAGLADFTRSAAEKMIAALDDGRPVLVDSAGCGAAMKDYGHLLGTPAAREFSKRVFDIQEWLANHVESLPQAKPLDLKVAVQDPCHLRHVQGVHHATRVVLSPFVRELVELDDDGMCCGAGGAYSALQPQLAAEVRARKLAAIARAGVDVVASANPGCQMHISAAGIRTRHPMEIIDDALSA